MFHSIFYLSISQALLCVSSSFGAKCFFYLLSGTVFSPGMRKWLLWWSQIQGCSVCLTRGDKAWNSRINSTCLCQMESSPTPLRWDNSQFSPINWFALFVNLCGVYTQQTHWPFLATHRFKFITKTPSCPVRLFTAGCRAALQSEVNVCSRHIRFTGRMSCQLENMFTSVS